MKIFKIILIISFAVLGIVSCSSKNKEMSERDLFPVPHIMHKNYDYGDGASPKYTGKDGKPVSGYIDRDGQLVINLKFDYADEFSNGLARVATDKKFGYINTNGEFVINPQFEDAENFGAGDNPLALVKSGGKYGYIDKSGNYAVSPQFDDAGGFTGNLSEVPGRSGYSLAGVKVGDKWGFIDKTGNFAVAPQFGEVGSFSEARAQVKVGDKCGYIDETGKMVIAAQYECSSSLEEFGVSSPIYKFGEFSEGLACVKIIDVETQTKAPDKLPGKDSSPAYPAVLAAKPKYKYGFIDRTGKFVIEPQFDIAGDFSQGLASIGFIKNITTLGLSEEVGLSEEGGGKFIANNVAQQIVKWGFINQTGNIVINPMFDSVKNFSKISDYAGNKFTTEYLSAAIIDEDSSKKCGYIDRTGKYVIKPQFSVTGFESFSDCRSFSHSGIAYMGTYNVSVIDNTGKVIFTYHR